MGDQKPIFEYPLPRCPEDGNDMAPIYDSFMVGKIIGFRCVKCDHKVDAF